MLQDPIWQEKSRHVAEGAPQAMPLAKQCGVKILLGDGRVLRQRRVPELPAGIRLSKRHLQAERTNAAGDWQNGEILKLASWKDPDPHGDIGVIAERTYANLLLIDCDPTQDIRLLMDADNIDLIMKDGVNCKDTL
jgi:imidazolonepropionase-like amidohydrolase